MEKVYAEIEDLSGRFILMDFVFKYTCYSLIRESPPHFENQIMARVYIMSTMRSTMYQKAPWRMEN